MRRVANVSRKDLARAEDALGTRGFAWHADLAHGGSQEIDPSSSRKSFVTHYCPIDRDPGYFRTAGHSEKIPYRSGSAYCHQLHIRQRTR